MFESSFILDFIVFFLHSSALSFLLHTVRRLIFIGLSKDSKQKPILLWYDSIRYNFCIIGNFSSVILPTQVSIYLFNTECSWIEKEFLVSKCHFCPFWWLLTSCCISIAFKLGFQSIFFLIWKWKQKLCK